MALMRRFNVIMSFSVFRRYVNRVYWFPRANFYGNQMTFLTASKRYLSGIQSGVNGNDTDEIPTLLLPTLDINNADDNTAEKVTMMRFDTLGPAVVTETGKMKFFEDWEGKTEQEKQDILKIVLPRNKHRLEQLKLQQDEPQAQEENVDTSTSSDSKPDDT